MPYRTDGSPHHSGIANEHAVVDFINNRSVSIRNHFMDSDDILVHVGGTTTKIDAKLIEPDGNTVHVGISIKNHKGGSSTFDWINTTQYTGFMTQELIDFKNRGVHDRNEFNSIFARNIHSISDDDGLIRNILTLCSDNNPDYILINNQKKSEYVFATTLENTPELRPLVNWTYFLKSGKGKTSAKIWRKQGDVEVDTSLRLRLVSNNGFNALFTQKGSVPTFKIQQEQVGRFVEGLDGIHERY